MPICTFAVIVPTLNAGNMWPEWVRALTAQTVTPSHVFVVDSTSTDGTDSLARASGFTVHTISPKEFNHGGTRQLAADLLNDNDLLVFLTQDALLASPNAIETLISSFHDAGTGAAYGRQLPYPHSSPISAHARLFNYPPTSRIKTLRDATQLGIKTAFISNSFAAYRTTALSQVGGFPRHTIMNEDMYVAARLILNGWSVTYSADAQVYHAHEYDLFEEFRRYFDIGVFQARESWIIDRFGKPHAEGLAYLRSELRYLLSTKPWLIISAILRSAVKFSGYHLGLKESSIPLRLKRRMSMHRRFWYQQSINWSVLSSARARESQPVRKPYE